MLKRNSEKNNLIKTVEESEAVERQRKKKVSKGESEENGENKVKQ